MGVCRGEHGRQVVGDHNGFRTDRWKFLASSLVVMSCAVLGAARPIVGQQVPVSAGPGAPELIDDLIAANRILAQEGVVDAFGHVSVRHNLRPEPVFPVALAGSGARHCRRSHRVRPGQQRASTRRAAPSIPSASSTRKSTRSRPDVRAVVHAHAPSVVPFGVSTVPLRPVFPYGRVHRRQRAHLRHPQGRRHDRHAGEGCSPWPRAGPGAGEQTRRADARPRRHGRRSRRCRSPWAAASTWK